MKLRHVDLVMLKRRDESLYKIKEKNFDDCGYDSIESKWAIVCYITAFFLAVIIINCFCILLSKIL